jgi:hypothetical protein
MPGYGLLDAAQGTGLLPWSWAVERLTRSHDYWVATVRPDGRPRVMPVWGVWMDDALWFSSSRGSRKARNLAANAHCTITTDNACFRVRPAWAFGLTEADFTGTPTRWTFASASD